MSSTSSQNNTITSEMNDNNNNNIDYVPINYHHIAKKLLYLIEKNRLATNYIDIKRTVIEVLEYCMDHPKLFIHKPALCNVVREKINSFEKIILENEERSSKVNIDTDLLKTIDNVSDTIKSCEIRSKMISLLVETRYTYLTYINGKSLNNMALLAIKETRSLLNRIESMVANNN